MKLAKIGLVAALISCAGAANAQLYDVFRINVPYQITLGTDQFRSIEILCQLQENYFINNKPSPASDNPPTVMINLDSNGAASGQITFEFKVSAKTVNSAGETVFLSYEKVSENLIVAEIFSETPGWVQQQGTVTVNCRIEKFVDQDGNESQQQTARDLPFALQEDRANSLALSADSRLDFTEVYDLSGNPRPSILPRNQPTSAAQVSPAGQQNVSPAVNQSLQDLLDRMSGGAN